MSPPPRISLPAARRIALAAQGFGRPRPSGRVTARQINSVVDRLGLLQLDSVNVLARSHYLPVFARLGPYPRDVLDRLCGHYPTRPRGRSHRPDYVEYWAHMASIVPVGLHPLLRWRMSQAADRTWMGLRALARDRPEFVAEVLRLVGELGPVRAGEIQLALGLERAAKTPGEMWNWDEAKMALEYLFYDGSIGSAGRVNFERQYDLIEKILPPEIAAAATPDPADAFRELIRIAARAYGVATEADLADYFRMLRAPTKQAIAELVEAGELLPVRVADWTQPAYVFSAARQPRRISAAALLSPFDPVVWFRDRALRLFDFHYRIEIYTRPENRIYGYYVLPFLLDERIVGRVDLKADRANGVLLVQAAWAEPEVDHDEVAARLSGELQLMAGWLGLDGVVHTGRGDLAPALAGHLE